MYIYIHEPSKANPGKSSGNKRGGGLFACSRVSESSGKRFLSSFSSPFLCSALSPVLLFKQYPPQCRPLVNIGL